MAAFESAVVTGNTQQLAVVLSNDIELYADGGGRVPTILNTLRGKTEMLDFVSQKLREYWADFDWLASDINGGPGIILQKDGTTVGSISFAYDQTGKATNIYIVRNPDKLERLSGAAIS